MKTLLFIFGTRPEAIKLAPLIIKFKELSSKYSIKVCVTGQHREMLDQILSFFKIVPDIDLELMKPNQTLFDITADSIRAFENVLDSVKPDLVFVQGDTTTAFTASLASFYKKIKVAHIEAGLRSNNIYSPFPEEANRLMVSRIASYHFAPTEQAVNNLMLENVTNNVFMVTNTVIDALKLGLNLIKEQGEDKYVKYFNYLDFSKKIILVTAHRRESFGDEFLNICKAIKIISEKYRDDVQIIYPVHLNPNVQIPVKSALGNIDNIFLVDPLDYPYLIWLMNKSYLILTDSGGIQEEGPALGKPVLVMRNNTERPEGVDAGTAKLVGTSVDAIVNNTSELLSSDEAYTKMSKSVNPYGVGEAADNVIKIIEAKQEL